MVNELQEARSKKRNRVLLSCTECHRRKQKCDRSQPCNDCAQRGLTQRCKYLKPTKRNSSSEQPSTEKTARSRLRRIMTGEDVTFTPESVAALPNAASSSLIGVSAKPVPYDEELDLHSLSPRVPGDFQSSRSRGPFPLAFRSRSPTVVSGFNAGFQSRFLGGFDPFSSLPSTGDDPITMELLVHYFVARLTPWLSYLDDDLTEFSPRISWLPFAMGHVPLFYATMLTAVVHLNRRSPLKDPSAMIWFKVQTMKLANERMNDPLEASSDEMIIVALVLLYFNVGGGNIEEYEIHLRGIHEMLKLRGGKENLGTRGMVKN